MNSNEKTCFEIENPKEPPVKYKCTSRSVYHRSSYYLQREET